MRVHFLNCIKIIMKKYCSLSYHLRLGLLILLILHCNVQLALAHRQGRPSSSAPSSSSSSSTSSSSSSTSSMTTTTRARLGSRAEASPAATAVAAASASAISTGRDRQITSAAAAAAAASVGWEPDCCYKTGHTQKISEPGCVEFEVTTNACRGYCRSFTVPTTHEVLQRNRNQLLTSFGTCCNIIDSEPINVRVMCFEGPREMTFQSATKCRCGPCKKY